MTVAAGCRDLETVNASAGRKEEHCCPCAFRGIPSVLEQRCNEAHLVFGDVRTAVETGQRCFGEALWMDGLRG